MRALPSAKEFVCSLPELSLRCRLWHGSRNPVKRFSLTSICESLSFALCTATMEVSRMLPSKRAVLARPHAGKSPPGRHFGTVGVFVSSLLGAGVHADDSVHRALDAAATPDDDGDED